MLFVDSTTDVRRFRVVCQNITGEMAKKEK